MECIPYNYYIIIIIITNIAVHLNAEILLCIRRRHDMALSKKSPAPFLFAEVIFSLLISGRAEKRRCAGNFHHIFSCVVSHSTN